MITVLGGRGFIGRNLIRHFKKVGEEVSTSEPSELLGDRKNHGHIIYCIGLTADFRSRPYATMEAHIGLLTEILKNSEFESFTYLSSTRLYQGAGDTYESELITVDPKNPSDLYNISKLAGESLCLNCGKDNVRIARLSNVVGYDETAENFLQSVIKEALSGRIVLKANPGSEKDFITMRDTVSLLHKISTQGQEPIYNIASGVNTKFMDILDKLSEITGCKIEVDKDADYQLFPPINTDRIQSEFSFAPQSILETLPDLVKEYSQDE